MVLIVVDEDIMNFPVESVVAKRFGNFANVTLTPFKGALLPFCLAIPEIVIDEVANTGK
jgi:hypothetical protein